MSHPTLWKARTESITYLSSERTDEIKVLEDLFFLIDRCIDVYEKSAAENQYARVCGLTVLKAKNLGIGAYSLILDGLGQEAGALLRPFIEYVELLTYFKRFPDKVEAAVDGKLPSAGERAKAINGVYKEYREFLNTHASHSSYSHHSLGHLLRKDTLQFRKLQKMVPVVLDSNIRSFSIQLYFLLYEAVVGLEFFAIDELKALAPDCDEIHARLISTFKLIR